MRNIIEALTERVRDRVITASDDTRAVWSRRTIAACALVAAAVLAPSIVYQPMDANLGIAGTDGQALAPPCLQWHQAASEVVSRLAQSTRDSDLRQANDAIFRLRRARRNCAEGWFTLACHDYYAIARNLPGHANFHQESLLACQRSADRPDEGARSITQPR
jgi:hypothetical protein